MSNINGSGDGSRPTTDGGADNIGAGEKFTGKKNAVGEDVSGPAPKEKMEDKKADAEATRHDDSAAFELHEDVKPSPSTDDNTR